MAPSSFHLQPSLKHLPVISALDRRDSSCFAFLRKRTHSQEVVGDDAVWWIEISLMFIKVQNKECELIYFHSESGMVGGTTGLCIRARFGPRAFS